MTSNDKALVVRGADDLVPAKGDHVFLGLDLSSSMAQPLTEGLTKLGAVAGQLPQYLERVRAAEVDMLGFVLFSDRVQGWPKLELELRPIAEVTVPTWETLRRQPVHGGNTALVDSILFSIEAARDLDPKRVRIIALTDGVENASKWTEEPSTRPGAIDKVREVQDAGTFIGIVGFTTGRDQETLFRLADELGVRNVGVAVHQGDAASVEGSIRDAGDTMTSFSTGQ